MLKTPECVSQIYSRLRNSNSGSDHQNPQMSPLETAPMNVPYCQSNIVQSNTQDINASTSSDAGQLLQSIGGGGVTPQLHNTFHNPCVTENDINVIPVGLVNNTSK